MLLDDGCSDGYNPEQSEGENIPHIVWKCTHTCPCAGSDSAISSIDGCSFTGKSGAQRHISTGTRHPKCTPSCPAFRWIGVAKFSLVKVLGVAVKRGTAKKRHHEYDSPPDVESEDTATTSSSPPPLPPSKRIRVEQETRFDHLPTPPRYSRLMENRTTHKMKASTTSNTTPARPAPGYTTQPQTPKKQTVPISAHVHRQPAAGVSHLSREDSTTPPAPPSPTTHPPAFLAHEQIDTHLTGGALLVQHYTVLNQARRSLTLIPPELEAISRSLHLLPFVTPHTAHFVADGDVTGAFQPVMKHVSDVLVKVHDVLHKLLQVEDSAGLVEGQELELRELRRRIAKLNDYVFELRLEMQKAGKNIEGFNEKKGVVKERLGHIRNEIGEAERRLKEMMEGSLDWLETLW